MHNHDATETAYRNGYEAGKRDAVKHGEWVSSRFNATYGEYEEQCSCCKGWSLEYDKPYYCSCGAKMDGGKNT